MNHLENKGPEYDFYGKLSLKKAIPLGLQHVLAMFVGNLTPILIISLWHRIRNRICRRADCTAAECHVDCRHRNINSAVCYRTGGR